MLCFRTVQYNCQHLCHLIFLKQFLIQLCNIFFVFFLLLCIKSCYQVLLKHVTNISLATIFFVLHDLLSEIKEILSLVLSDLQFASAVVHQVRLFCNFMSILCFLLLLISCSSKVNYCGFATYFLLCWLFFLFDRKHLLQFLAMDYQQHALLIWVLRWHQLCVLRQVICLAFFQFFWRNSTL